MIDPIITAVAISLGSYHFNKDPTKEYTQINPGIIAEVNHAYIVGMYRNSWNRATWLAGYRFNLAEFGSVNMGAIVAACTGYDYPVCGALNFHWGSLSVIATPPVKGHGAAVGFAYRWELK